ncbi:hypothetical protein [Glutamicibacter sp. 2E12]|uniref:hypothetical protein n=1 Tax=Glutamicibacter sp. 2E12 TaxID=3416181 RepID=UPI003CF0E096
MSNLFDPIAGENFGECTTCNQPMATEKDMHDHWASNEGKGHRVRVMNPPRAQQIRNHVQRSVDEAMSSFYSEMDSLIAQGHLTEEEAKNAMKTAFVDVADGWEEYSSA